MARILLLAIFFWASQARCAEITVVPLGKQGEAAVFVDGDITFEDREKFLIKISPFNTGIVVFNSKGGSAYAGIEIGKTIRLRNFATWVPSGSFCASACAAAWLGGTRRLMGRTALIGFHSVYVLKNGTPQENSSGNAIFGAYLSQLGLSDKAIFYLTAAPPESMNWLTPAQAEQVGISLRVFDEDIKKPEQTPAPQVTESLEVRSRKFVVALSVLVSGPNEKLIPLLNGLYADQVNYYGKLVSRGEVASQIYKFTERWPLRVYATNPSSITVACDEHSSECRVQGLLDFDAKNVVRNQRSHGTATFDYVLAFRPGSRWPVIATEKGTVVNRQLEALIGEGESLVTSGPSISQ